MNNVTLLIITSTGIILLFTAGYLALMMTGNKKIIAQQQSKIEEIQKSEERYKTLFENSVAGMMKFNFTTWAVLEANQTLLTMFNSTTVYELQKNFTDLHFTNFAEIGKTLGKYGAVDGVEILYAVKGMPPKKFIFSARRERNTDIAHGVMVYVNSQKKG